MENIHIRVTSMIVLESGQIPAMACHRGMGHQMEPDQGFHWPAHSPPKSSPGSSVPLDRRWLASLATVKWEL